MSTKKTNIDENKILTEIEVFLANGVDFNAACLSCGVGLDAAKKWIREGKKFNNGFPKDFYIAVSKGLARFEASIVKKIIESGDPKNLKWILEKKFPEKWGDGNSGNINIVENDKKAIEDDEYIDILDIKVNL